MSSPVSTMAPDGSNQTGGGGADYFFGFLIIFVGLLIIFLACALGSRRRSARRRERRLNGVFQARRLSDSELEGEEAPQFYDHLFVLGEDKWNGLMPLSATLLRGKETTSVVHEVPAAPPATPARSRNITSHLFPWFNKNTSLKADTDLEPPDTIQVAVMIIMPYRALSPKIPGVLPEYQIGEINLPWSGDR